MDFIKLKRECECGNRYYLKDIEFRTRISMPQDDNGIKHYNHYHLFKCTMCGQEYRTSGMKRIDLLDQIRRFHRR